MKQKTKQIIIALTSIAATISLISFARALGRGDIHIPGWLIEYTFLGLCGLIILNVVYSILMNIFIDKE